MAAVDFDVINQFCGFDVATGLPRNNAVSAAVN
jgi:hypothetical protein